MVKQARFEGSRKPVRPLERQRMRPWMYNQLNEGQVPGLEWVDKKRGIFKIRWLHAALHGHSTQNDSLLFEKWAVHTGRRGNTDHKRWKANFRCALHSLPDLKEVKTMGISRGRDAYKVFQFLDEAVPKTEKRTRRLSSESSEDMQDDPDYQCPSVRTNQESDSDGEDTKEHTVMSESSDSPVSDSDGMEVNSDCESPAGNDLPFFDKICPSLNMSAVAAENTVTTTLPNHLCGSRYTRRSSTSSRDEDNVSTTSSNMTDDEVVQLVLDAELLEVGAEGESEVTEYSSDLWNTPVAQEIITGEDGTTYIVLTESAQMPVVTLPGTETNHYDITSIVVGEDGD